MTTQLESQEIKSYLKETQRLIIISQKEPERYQELLEYIENQKTTATVEEQAAEFYLGEMNFYNKDYQRALVHYMQARNVPEFEFFCFRASAHISYENEEFDKAKDFIDKAMQLHPQDYLSLKLKQEVLIKLGENEQAEQVHSRLLEKEEKDQAEQSVEPPAVEVVETETPAESEKELNPFLESDSTNQYIAAKLGVDLETEKELENRIENFKSKRQEMILGYLEESKAKSPIMNHTLSILNGWGTPDSGSILFNQNTYTSHGGYYLRWNDKGIVINPGEKFLQYFHERKLHISDIDYVIVTRAHKQAYADITKIYDLNYQLNKASPELHVIHYYLNHKAYQELSHALKPNFKQERNTLHSLELFLDSPDVEKEQLCNGITLNYFSTASRGAYSQTHHKDTALRHSHSLGIRLDLLEKSASDEKMRTIGYLSGTAWSPMIAHHLGKCDLLITGLGVTNANDYGKLNYQETNLGYFGSYTLLEEIKPKILLVSEFDGREGDIRLELTKKMRKEYRQTNNHEHSVIFPGDKGLFFDLKSLEVECSVTHQFLKPKEVIVMKTKDSFGKLHYLSSKSLCDRNCSPS